MTPNERRALLYQVTEAHEEILALLRERDRAWQETEDAHHAAEAAYREAETARRDAEDSKRLSVFLGEHAKRFGRTLARLVQRRRERDEAGQGRTPAMPSASVLSTSDEDKPVAEPIVTLPPVAEPARQQAPRVLLDVTETAFHEVVSGIPRFVREIAKAFYASGEGLPVVLIDGEFWTIYDGFPKRRRITFEQGDILLVPDIHYRHTAALAALLAELQAVAGKFVVYVHDIIPLTYPLTCYFGVPEAYARWFDFVATQADALVTPSAAEARTIIDYLQSIHLARSLQIGWVPGASSLRPASRAPSPVLAAALEGGRCFLMVGYFEPRKGHALALDAFERLWARGIDVKLLIISHGGWGARHVELKIRSHERFGRSLLWIADADDAQLAHAYAGCAALISPSLTEGYGLPLVEAASFGAHRIVSDIPVFREVAGDQNVTFVPLCDAEALSCAIEAVPARVPGASCAAPGMSWTDSAALLGRMVRAEGYQTSYQPDREA